MDQEIVTGVKNGDNHYGMQESADLFGIFGGNQIADDAGCANVQGGQLAEYLHRWQRAWICQQPKFRGRKAEADKQGIDDVGFFQRL